MLTVCVLGSGVRDREETMTKHKEAVGQTQSQVEAAPLSRTEVFAAIIAERDRQDRKWGEFRPGEPTMLAVLTEEVGEVARAMLDDEPPARLREELVQVAAVVVRWLEQDRRREVGHV